MVPPACREDQPHVGVPLEGSADHEVGDGAGCVEDEFEQRGLERRDR
jgi:hypothetical protein